MTPKYVNIYFQFHKHSKSITLVGCNAYTIICHPFRTISYTCNCLELHYKQEERCLCCYAITCNSLLTLTWCEIVNTSIYTLFTFYDITGNLNTLFDLYVNIQKKPLCVQIVCWLFDMDFIYTSYCNSSS